MKQIISFTVILIILSSILFNVHVEKISAGVSSFRAGLDTAGQDFGYSKDKTNLIPRIGKIINIATTFLGVIFLGLMIYAGYLWMLARGNEQEVEKAKNIIIYAVVGLVVVLAAYAITQTIYWYFYGIKYYKIIYD